MTGRSTTGDALWQRLHALGKAERDAYSNGDGKALPTSQRFLLASDVGLLAMVRALAERVESLERQLAEGTVSYKGIWSADQQYRRGDLTTLSGNVWHANRPTTSKPGEAPHSDWTLMVRKGKDGRDARP